MLNKLPHFCSQNSVWKLIASQVLLTPLMDKLKCTKYTYTQWSLTDTVWASVIVRRIELAVNQRSTVYKFAHLLWNFALAHGRVQYNAMLTHLNNGFFCWFWLKAFAKLWQQLSEVEITWFLWNGKWYNYHLLSMNYLTNHIRRTKVMHRLYYMFPSRHLTKHFRQDRIYIKAPLLTHLLALNTG